MAEGEGSSVGGHARMSVIRTCERASSARVAPGSVSALISSASGRGSGAGAFATVEQFLIRGLDTACQVYVVGCLGLTRGDRLCRCQFSEEDSPNRRRRPGHRLVCHACLAGRSANSSRRRGQAADRPVEPDEFPRNGSDHDRRLLPSRQHLPVSRYRAQSRTCGFHAMERISPGSPSCRR